MDHLWRVAPQQQSLAVYRLLGFRYRPVGQWRGAERVRAEPFEVLALELAVCSGSGNLTFATQA